MTAQKGRSFLLKVDNGSGTYNTIGGVQSLSMVINNEPVDISNADSAGIRTLLENAGLTSVDITCSGIYLDTDTNGLHRVRAVALANTFTNFKFVTPGSTNDGDFSGSFHISSFELNAEYNGTGKNSIKLASAGAITFTTTA
jgi:TP901-1 family phage major tail protein